MPLLLIGLGGFAGAISRYLVDGFVTDRTAGAFPWGTLAVNLSGSFVLGLLFAMTTERAILPADIRGPGHDRLHRRLHDVLDVHARVVGARSRTARTASAVANLGGSVLLGLVAVVAGLTVGRAI